MLYPSKIDGEQWNLSDVDPNNDGRLLVPKNIKINSLSSAGYYFINDNSESIVRFSVLTSVGQPATNCNVNFTNLSTTGYRFTPKDWKNVEFTFVGYIQNLHDNANKTDGYIFLEARSGKKIDPKPCCDGHSYGINAYWANEGESTNAGKTGFIKSLFYNSNKVLKSQTSITDTFYRRWFGLKFIIYNYIGADNNVIVRLEKWFCPSDSADDLANKWYNAGVTIDNGLSWSKGGTQCNGTDRQAITWGSYLCNFGFTGGPAEIRFKSVSVREIDPLASFTSVQSGSSSGSLSTIGPLNSTIWRSSTSAGNGVSREIHGHEARDHYDNAVAVASGDSANRSLDISGDGYYLFSGSGCKFKIYVENYDSQLELKVTPNSTLESIGFRLRSRYNKTGFPVNRFGGYECKIITNLNGSGIQEINWLREDYRDKYTLLGSDVLSINQDRELEDDTAYKIRISVKDDAKRKKRVNLKLEIDYNDGNGFVVVSQCSDNDALDYMIDRELYYIHDFDTAISVSSYAWIQINGTNPQNVRLEDIVLKDISDVVGGGVGV